MSSLATASRHWLIHCKMPRKPPRPTVCQDLPCWRQSFSLLAAGCCVLWCLIYPHLWIVMVVVKAIPAHRQASDVWLSTLSSQHSSGLGAGKPGLTTIVVSDWAFCSAAVFTLRIHSSPLRSWGCGARGRRMHYYCGEINLPWSRVLPPSKKNINLVFWGIKLF